MRTLYALAALGLFAAPSLVEAQRGDLQTWPAVDVSIDGDVSTVYSFNDLSDTPFEAPIIAEEGDFYVGYSVWDYVVTEFVNGDSTMVDTVAHFDLAPVYTQDGVMAEVAIADPIDACTPLTNPGDLAGKIALVQRGACNFTDKAIYADQAGAVGTIIWIPGPNNDLGGGQYDEGTPPFGMGFSPDRFIEVSDTLTIDAPVVMVGNGVGQVIFDEVDLGSEVMVRLYCAPEDPDGNTQVCPTGQPEGYTVITPAALAEAQGTAIENIELPQGVTSMKAYPNPTAGMARVALTTAAPEAVRVEVYNTLGQRVAVLHDGQVNGQVDLDLDGSSLATGLYLVRATGETFSQTTRVTIAR